MISKIDAYEYLAVEGILSSNRRQIIAKFTYHPLGQSFGKTNRGTS